MKNFVILLFTAFALTTSCTKDRGQAILISGEFARTEGTCTPYCIITISGETLTLEGIDYSGSTDIVYVEIYKRTDSDNNKYEYTVDPDSYIEVNGLNAFTFTSATRTCKFKQ